MPLLYMRSFFFVDALFLYLLLCYCYSYVCARIFSINVSRVHARCPQTVLTWGSKFTLLICDVAIYVLGM